MKHSIRVIRRPRRAWPPTTRTATAVVATAALALAAAAYGSSQSSPAAGGSSHARASALSQSTNAQQALAYARCVRSHGVPRYPDPSSGNETPSGLPKVGLQQLGVSSAQLQAAEKACRRLLPAGAQSTPAASQQMLRKMVMFAHCMRSHGVSNWPDPKASTPAELAVGAPPYMFHLEGLQSLDGRSFPPHIARATSECQHLTGAQVPYTG